MNIPPSEISSKEEVGKKGHSKVFMISTIGGLCLCAIASATPQIASIAPHPAVAKFLAQKKFPDIEFYLKKSEDIQINNFSDIVDKYEAVTDAVIALQLKSK
jgi:hypothetical protein